MVAIALIKARRRRHSPHVGMHFDKDSMAKNSSGAVLPPPSLSTCPGVDLARSILAGRRCRNAVATRRYRASTWNEQTNDDDERQAGEHLDLFTFLIFCCTRAARAGCVATSSGTCAQAKPDLIVVDETMIVA